MQFFMLKGDLKKQLERNVRQHKNIYMFNGIIFIILGLVSIMTPLVAAEFFDVLIGSLLLITGFAQAIVSMQSRRHWSYYLSAVVSIAAGALMVSRPSDGALALAAIVALFLLLQGFLQIFSASLYAPFKGWIVMLLSGIVSIALSALIYVGWPSTALWFLGIVVAINLISFGSSILILTSYMTK